MPRPPVKTYGRSQVKVNTSSFDAIMNRDPVMPSTTQAAQTIHRWGKTSFTSKRNVNDNELLKRKADDYMDADSPTESSLFSDPFSFDSDDDGPSKPKRGMGFKANVGKNKRGKTVTTKRKVPETYRASAGTTFPKSNSSKTYSQTGKAAMAKSGVAALPNRAASDNRQSTLDRFTLKVSHKNGSTVVTNSGTVISGDVPGKTQWDILVGNSKNCFSERKFFTSASQQNSAGSTDDHTYSQSSVITINSTTTEEGIVETADDHCSISDEEQVSQPSSDHIFSSSPPRSTSPLSQDNAAPMSSHSSHSSDSPFLWNSDCDSDWEKPKESKGPKVTVKVLPKREKAIKKDSRFKVTSESSPITIDSEDTNSQGSCGSRSDLAFEMREALASIKSCVAPKEKATSGASLAETKSPVEHAKSGGVPLERAKTGVVLTERGKSGGIALERAKSAHCLSSRSSSQVEPRETVGLKHGAENKKKERPLVRRLLTSPKKAAVKSTKASYNPRQWHDPDDEQPPTVSPPIPPASSTKQNVFTDFDDDDAIAPPTRLRDKPLLRKSYTDPGRPGHERSALKVDRDQKPLFTVVRNVKQAHECQEHGETLEFQDELEYIMPGLRDSQSVATRCLSLISLATKCIVPAFRMHLRAHGLLTEIFTSVHDAPQHQTLGLCTAALMFMNSRDRLHMDLERSDLTLMLHLLNSEASSEGGSKEEQRVHSKISSILERFRKEGSVKDFTLDDVSTGKLAMEALLSLTSRGAGEWFKDELRTLGGLDHIINTVCTCADDIDEFEVDPTPSTLNHCCTIDRCLRVLENVTYMNSDNQTHLITYKSSVLLHSLHRVLRVCGNILPFHEVTCVDSRVDKSSPGYIVLSSLLSIFRVLLNITHDNTLGSTKAGQLDGFIADLLSCILKTPQYIPADQRFDLYVLSLGLSINLVEHCDHNRRLMVKTTTTTPFEQAVQSKVDSVEALTMLFLRRHEDARRIEEEHDAELDEREKRRKQESTARPVEPSTANQSGRWLESDSGLEWVVNTLDDTDQSDPYQIPDPSKIEDLKKIEDPSKIEDPMMPGSQEDDINFTEALHKAGKHMEDCLVAAYLALLIGCLLQYNADLAERVRCRLPDSSYVCMIRVLKKFLGFMNFTSGTVGNTGSKSIMKVVELLESYEA